MVHLIQVTAWMYSLLSSVQEIAPICAPVFGGILLAAASWKGIFRILFAIGLLLIISMFFLKESLDTDKRQAGNLHSMIAGYKASIRNAPFMRYVLVQAFAMGVMFAYIAASPFIFQMHLGVSPQAYGVCFGLNAVALMIGSLPATKFRDTTRALRYGCTGFGTASIAVGAALSACSAFPVVETALFLLLFFLGIILPSSTTLALDMERHNSGTASAMLGFLAFLFGGMLSPLTGIGNMLYGTSGVIVACSMATLYLQPNQENQRKQGEHQNNEWHKA